MAICERICGTCRWMIVAEDSAGHYIDICVNCGSPCYCEMTGDLAGCKEWESEWEDEDYGL